MANILAVGIYMAEQPNTAAHVMYQLASSKHHNVVQRWIALSPDGRGRCDLPSTEKIVTIRTPKFTLLDQLTLDALDFDWALLCDDDIELGSAFVDNIIGFSDKFDFALSQPARTVDSFTDHPIVQVMPGLLGRRTRFVEIGPVVCIRRDAMPYLLPFGLAGGMGWGLDFVWPLRLEKAGLRLGILDIVPVAHRFRPPVSSYTHSEAHLEMSRTLARHPHISLDEAFSVLEVFT